MPDSESSKPSAPEKSGVERNHNDPFVRPSLSKRIRRWLIGAPRDLADSSIAHKLSLIAVLAWIGLGADALSSSSYGPEEAFKALGTHSYLALPLALMTAATVILIAAAYSKVIEVFPNGGGYGVATRMLGSRVGVVSGSALLIDYVLTITASIAALGDVLFSLAPLHWQPWKVPCEAAVILLLTLLNMRGVRESILVMAPIFVVFVITHAILIGGGLIIEAPTAIATAEELNNTFQKDLITPGVGLVGLIALLLNAYAMGGGTYTGIEAVSNAMPLMREPRLQTAKRTMIYLSISLAITAGGLILCYLLWHVSHVEGKTMNAVLVERFAPHLPFGSDTFIWVTLLSEALLLAVAAQAGFVGGPRVMANLAVDSWLPRRFASLSDRLTTENGVLFMGGAALLFLVGTWGSVDMIVIMYSINVFLTFSLTMAGMLLYWWRRRDAGAWLRRRRLILFAGGTALCVVILGVTTYEKFGSGGWVTIIATGLLATLCFLINRHYRSVSVKLRKLYQALEQPTGPAKKDLAQPDPKLPTAVVLVSGYVGPGIHTTLNIFKSFPHLFKNLVFVSVGVVDSGDFKGEDTVAPLRERTQSQLDKYVALAASLGIPATSRMAVGTDPVEEAVQLCRQVKAEFPHATFFAGKVLFANESWYHAILHNDTAVAVQKRLMWEGLTVVVLPARCA
ncbi:MAG: APC family permease [Planctomycetota bacterium]